MSEPDPLERAATSLLSEPIPSALTATVVEDRAGRIRRRHRALTTVAAVLVVVVLGAAVLGVRRSSSSSLIVDTPAARVNAHTHRYRFPADVDEATRLATVERVTQRYRSLGDQVTSELGPGGELSLTDALPPPASDQAAAALTFVGATSLRGVIREVGVPSPPVVEGAGASCPPGSVPQWEPTRRELMACFEVDDQLVVAAGDGALAADVSLTATASSGTMDLQVSPGLQAPFAELQAACAERRATCPLGRVALMLDETVAGTTPVPAPVPPVAGRLTIEGLFNREDGPWLGAILRTGKLPVPLTAEGVGTGVPATAAPSPPAR